MQNAERWRASLLNDGCIERERGRMEGGWREDKGDERHAAMSG